VHIEVVDGHPVDDDGVRAYAGAVAAARSLRPPADISWIVLPRVVIALLLRLGLADWADPDREQVLIVLPRERLALVMNGDGSGSDVSDVVPTPQELADLGPVHTVGR
jgi:hypothetical protein